MFNHGPPKSSGSCYQGSVTVGNADLVSLRLLFFGGKLRQRQAVGFAKVMYLDKGKGRAWSAKI